MPNQVIVSKTPFESDAKRNRCVLSCGHTILLSTGFSQDLVQCPLCRIALLRANDSPAQPSAQQKPLTLEEQVGHLLQVGRRHWNGVNACEEAITKLIGPSDWTMEWFWHDKSAAELIAKVKSQYVIATSD